MKGSDAQTPGRGSEKKASRVGCIRKLRAKKRRGREEAPCTSTRGIGLV